VTGSYYGLYGWPLGINDNGAVVGSDLVGGASHAVLWNGVSATSTDLGVMSGGGYSVAEDVNNANFVAGYGDRTIPQPPPFTPVTTDAGFLWHPDFGKYELPGIPGNLFGKCRAHALNERQSSSGLVQVVGYCTDTTGAVRAVRWDVTVTSVSILPPPFRP
jgi:uncharacterized membrane protein